MVLQSGIIVTNSPKEALERLSLLRRGELFTIIDTEGKEFLIEHAKEAINKAFIANEIEEFIILIAPKFSIIAQNKLLKTIEEPPKNKNFIIITESKSSILPTIKSRLPIILSLNREGEKRFDLDIANLNLARVYEFIQNNKKHTPQECKEIIEYIVKESIKSQKYNLDELTLNLFTNSIKALDLGSPCSFNILTVLLKLLAQKR